MSTPWPTGIKVNNLKLSLNEALASTQSVFTRARQVATLAGGTADMWEGTITTVNLSQADVQRFLGWQTAVGMYGQFTVQDPDYTGAASGVSIGLVRGASQTGTQLAVDGLPPSTLIWRLGEQCQVDDQLLVATEDCTSDGSGLVTLHFKPALRVSPADNTNVIFDAPVLTVLLTSMPMKVTDNLRMGAQTISFSEL
jgi:hypothetical protein